MAQDQNAQDPLDFVRGMWNNMGFSLPGMVTPTLDVDELDKRITDMKAVEGWLKMNLNMLQMSIQGLELQRATLSAMKAMGSDELSGSNPFAAAAAMWQPWNLMAGAAGSSPATEAAQAAAPTKPATKPPAKS